MSLTVADLRAFLRRVQRAVQQNHGIALAEHYASQLGGTDSSPAGLLKACKAALSDTAEDVQPPPPVDVEVDVDLEPPPPVEPAPIPGNDHPTLAPSAAEPVEPEDISDDPVDPAEGSTDETTPASKKKRRRPSK